MIHGQALEKSIKDPNSVVTMLEVAVQCNPAAIEFVRHLR